MRIETVPKGYNSGRPYVIKFDTEEDAARMLKLLLGMVRWALADSKRRKTFLEKFREIVGECYTSTLAQGVVA